MLWRGMDSLQQLLTCSGQLGSTLYYRLLDMPLAEWESMKTVKVRRTRAARAQPAVWATSFLLLLLGASNGTVRPLPHSGGIQVCLLTAVLLGPHRWPSTMSEQRRSERKATGYGCRRQPP